MSKSRVYRNRPTSKEAQMLRIEAARAAKQGLDNDHNPYRRGNAWHTAWKRGWTDAYKVIVIDRIKSLRAPLEPNRLSSLGLDYQDYEDFVPSFIEALTDMGFSNRQAEEFKIECVALLERRNTILAGSQ